MENSSKDGNTRPLTCLLRNLYAGQKATVRSRRGTTDWFKTVNRIHRGCVLSPCLFNVYAQYIMQNAGLDESQAGIKTARRNNNLRYADDTTLMVESEEELKSLLTRVKKLAENSVFKNLRSGHPITSSAAAAAKSLQSCPTLCDPRDGSPPGSPVPGILQARTLEWVAISFSNAGK